MYNIVHHFQPRRAGARLQRRPHARLIPLRVLLALIVTHHHAAPRACSSISQGCALIFIRHLRQRLMQRWQRRPGQRQLLAGRRRKGSTKLSTSSMKPLSSSKTAASDHWWPCLQSSERRAHFLVGLSLVYQASSARALKRWLLHILF